MKHRPYASAMFTRRRLLAWVAAVVCGRPPCFARSSVAQTPPAGVEIDTLVSVVFSPEWLDDRELGVGFSRNELPPDSSITWLAPTNVAGLAYMQQGSIIVSGVYGNFVQQAGATPVPVESPFIATLEAGDVGYGPGIQGEITFANESAQIAIWLNVEFDDLSQPADRVVASSGGSLGGAVLGYLSPSDWSALGLTGKAITAEIRTIRLQPGAILISEERVPALRSISAGSVDVSGAANGDSLFDFTLPQDNNIPFLPLPAGGVLTIEASGGKPAELIELRLLPLS